MRSTVRYPMPGTRSSTSRNGAERGKVYPPEPVARGESRGRRENLRIRRRRGADDRVHALFGREDVEIALRGELDVRAHAIGPASGLFH
jgi:hypothetical protein